MNAYVILPSQSIMNCYLVSKILQVSPQDIFTLWYKRIHFFSAYKSWLQIVWSQFTASKMLLCSLSQLDDSRRGIKRWSKRCWRYHDRNWFVLMFNKNYSLPTTCSILIVDTTTVRAIKMIWRQQRNDYILQLQLLPATTTSSALWWTTNYYSHNTWSY